MKISANKNETLVKEIRTKLKANDGYCPCQIGKTPETRCMCVDFLENTPAGEYCICGLYLKEEG